VSSVTMRAIAATLLLLLAFAAVDAKDKDVTSLHIGVKVGCGMLMTYQRSVDSDQCCARHD